MARKWAITKNEKYAEWWFKDNGFEFELVNQFVSKTVYKVSKDGITDKFELPSGVTDPKGYMNMFDRSFNMLKEITVMKEKLSKEGEV